MWLDCDLEYAIPLIRKEVVCGDDVVESVVMRHQDAEIEALRRHHVHQPPHPLLAAGAQGRDDAVIAQPRRERGQRNAQIGRVHAKA